MAKVKKTFSLEKEDIKLLEQIAQTQDLTQSEVIKRALSVYNSSLDSKAQEKEGNNSELVFSLRGHIKDLQSQISIKDEQISALNENLKAQQTISALISPQIQKQLSGAGVSKAPRKSLFSRLFNKEKTDTDKE